jgi:hypothetical protein
MRYIKILPALLLMAVTAGCGNSSDEDKTTSESSSTTAPAPTTVGTDASTTQPVQQQAPATTTIQAPVVNTPNQPVSSQTVSKAGLNPAHGQPGHRCDISVGAPLDSKPIQPTVSTTQPVVTQQATPAMTTNTPTPVSKVAPGMNPAHGQPGHRCDIAVGSPLNSKPTQ